MIDALDDDGVLCDGDIAVSDISSKSDACDGVIVCRASTAANGTNMKTSFHVQTLSCFTCWPATL